MPIEVNELQANAALTNDVFLHVQTKRAGKVKGEGATEGHVGDIQVFAWAWGVGANTAIGATDRTARRCYKHLVITKGIDASTTGLMSALVTNDEVKEATLTMRKGGGDTLDYFRMTLNGARVIGVDVDVAAHGGPLERVTFAFTKVEIEYQQQQGSGISSGACSFSDEVMSGS
jgi:type VI secretion system secreted protein Hcp